MLKNGDGVTSLNLVGWVLIVISALHGGVKGVLLVYSPGSSNYKKINYRVTPYTCTCTCSLSLFVHGFADGCAHLAPLAASLVLLPLVRVQGTQQA